MPLKIMTIAISHVEYETDKRHYARGLPGARGLAKEMTHHRGGPDGRGDFGGECCR